jgi:site-specific DNA-methyltransferase (adenine-specific)
MPADANGTVAVGRWPANLILDDSFTHQWSRFFYQAKASTNERTKGTTNGNNHPCVKPLDLTRYLAQLMLPPAGETPRQLLVPFSGSGSEMIGGLLAGWDEVVGIEKEPEYVAIAQERLAQFCLDY